MPGPLDVYRNAAADAGEGGAGCSGCCVVVLIVVGLSFAAVMGWL